LNTFSCSGLNLSPGAQAALSFGKSVEWDQGFTANPFTSGMGGSKFPALNPLNFKIIPGWGGVLQPGSNFSSSHGLGLLQDSGGMNFCSLGLHRQRGGLKEEKDFFPWEPVAKLWTMVFLKEDHSEPPAIT